MRHSELEFSFAVASGAAQQPTLIPFDGHVQVARWQLSALLLSLCLSSCEYISDIHHESCSFHRSWTQTQARFGFCLPFDSSHIVEPSLHKL